MSYRILKSSNPRIHKNNPNRKKTKGQKEVVTANQIRKMEKILQNKSLEDCTLIQTTGKKSKSRGFRLDN